LFLSYIFVQLGSKASSKESQLSTVKADRHLTTANVSPSVPDLLDPGIAVDSSVELHLPQSPVDRLTMLGGVSGMLARMDCDKAAPDVKTFSLLLELMPFSIEAENHLLSSMHFYNVEADVDFYNMLIRRRNFRKDFEGARVSWTVLCFFLLLHHVGMICILLLSYHISETPL